MFLEVTLDNESDPPGACREYITTMGGIGVEPFVRSKYYDYSS